MVLVPVAGAKIVLNGVVGAQSPGAVKLPHVEHLVVARVTRDHLLISTAGGRTMATRSVRSVVLVDLARSTAEPIVMIAVGVVVARTIVLTGVLAGAARPLQDTVSNMHSG